MLNLPTRTLSPSGRATERRERKQTTFRNVNGKQRASRSCSTRKHTSERAQPIQAPFRVASSPPICKHTMPSESMRTLLLLLQGLCDGLSQAQGGAAEEGHEVQGYQGLTVTEVSRRRRHVQSYEQYLLAAGRSLRRRGSRGLRKEPRCVSTFHISSVPGLHAAAMDQAPCVLAPCVSDYLDADSSECLNTGGMNCYCAETSQTEGGAAAGTL